MANHNLSVGCVEMIQPEPFANSDFSDAANEKGGSSHPPFSPLAPEMLAPQSIPSLEGLATADTEVLRQELVTLHQFLQQQQSVIQGLSEQLSCRDAQLGKWEQELQESKQQCRRQAEQLQEMEAVCQDLRSQLRRQQQRTSQYMQALTQQTAQPLNGVVYAPLESQTYMAFAYEAITVTSSSQAKTAPVSAWSATNMTESLALYQKLAAMTTSPLPGESSNSSRCQRGHWQQSSPQKTVAPARVELPSFTRQSHTHLS